jgi:hypothetical protein
MSSTLNNPAMSRNHHVQTPSSGRIKLTPLLNYGQNGRIFPEVEEARKT